MRHMMRKPVEMKVRDYFVQYFELNNYLKRFPPFNGLSQMLPQDKVLEHAEFAIPNSWQKQMVLHRFNATSCMLDQFMDFCECLEVRKSLYNTTHKKSQKAKTQKSSNGDSTQKTTNQNNSRKKQIYYCCYHSNNKTHPTVKCKVLSRNICLVITNTIKHTAVDNLKR